jgi:uncharacterized protein YyaL (SSP411 family)
LIQHAHNPVNWFPWGPEAFEVARALGRPILLSVGYSTCHWCHVMEVESFEDEEIASFINAHFVPIKVDREERPDVDSVYMAAVQMMSRNGGWPMTVVMTPDGRPFFGGTYFPPRDGARGTRVGLLTILQKLSEAFATSPEKVAQSAQHLAEMLEINARSMRPQGVPGPESLIAAARQLVARFDPENGGFGTAPKFPRPSTFALLLRVHRRSGDEVPLIVVKESLRAMIRGGIYDQIGAGFHRYSTDEKWLVPHFEKMLYDNAQLVSLLVEAHQATGESIFAYAARETLDYVAREMTSPEGGFYSATDADSEGDEGRFFVWTKDEMEKVLGPERARNTAAYFGVTAEGNFEGKNVLHRPRTDEEWAEELKVPITDLIKEIGENKKILFDARQKRVHPLRDDKILTEWNGQMISAFARAGARFDEKRYVDLARRAADFILDALRKDGRLLRVYSDGIPKHAAVLEDYAFFIDGLLELFDATSEARWLEEAIALEDVLEKHYLDERDGAFYSTPSDGEKLLVREKPSYDGAQPSGNAVASLNLLRLAELTSREHYRKIAEKSFMALGASLERGAIEAPMLACALDYYLDKPKEVVIIATASDPGAALITAARNTFLPNRVFIRTTEGDPREKLAQIVPLLKDKRALHQRATAYVCTDYVCQAPTSSPDVLRKQLAQLEPLPLERKMVLPH